MSKLKAIDWRGVYWVALCVGCIAGTFLVTGCGSVVLWRALWDRSNWISGVHPEWAATFINVAWASLWSVIAPPLLLWAVASVMVHSAHYMTQALNARGAEL